jgi:hypothetical protein
MALGLVLAVGVTGFALADGASDNVSTVKGKVTPKKLPKRKFAKATLNSGVTTLDADNDPVIPDQAAEQVFIDYDDDIKINLTGVPACNANLEPLDTAGAKAACPGSVISIAGSAAARIPGFPTPNNEVSDFTVTAFRGSTAKTVLLKAHSPTLGTAGGAAPVVVGTLGASPLGGDYGIRLSVPNAPDVAGDTGALVRFEATLRKGGAIKARCHDRNKKFNYKAKFVYDDLSVDNASASSACAIRR